MHDSNNGLFLLFIIVEQNTAIAMLSFKCVFCVGQADRT